ncbi:zinc finger and BTB domain-containing protein 37 isoform X2 [Scyliorhinus canicula]|uniref:zinc finger and BTB domain-containing protein 37 isoform X2 n=1 Tax=Scyliorhinus canicula TaxID=7830 RepID=UPI0018F3A5F3|nr:zinc finger and BTB domain-containing protein 37 isoform X2 [Scyliorhinus canicula]
MEKDGSIQLEVPDFSSSVLAQLNQLRMQGRLCDIVVDVQGKSFRAHKAVLAASSPYFRDHMSLGEMSAVSISVIKSPAVFERLLAFCYTGKLCLQVADIISYLTAASFLQMQYIIDKCTQILDGIHFRIDVSEVEAGLNQDGPKRPAQSRIGSVATPNTRRSRAPSGFGRRSPLPDELGSTAGDERLVRIDRVGQWYVETGVSGDRSPEGIRQIGGMRIKTETPDEWIMSENQPSGEDGSSAEEVTAMVIDSAGHSSLVQEAYPNTASSGKISRPSSSFSEIDSVNKQLRKLTSPRKIGSSLHPSEIHVVCAPLTNAVRALTKGTVGVWCVSLNVVSITVNSAHLAALFVPYLNATERGASHRAKMRSGNSLTHRLTRPPCSASVAMKNTCGTKRWPSAGTATTLG